MPGTAFGVWVHHSGKLHEDIPDPLKHIIYSRFQSAGNLARAAGITKREFYRVMRNHKTVQILCMIGHDGNDEIVVRKALDRRYGADEVNRVLLTHGDSTDTIWRVAGALRIGLLELSNIYNNHDVEIPLYINEIVSGASQ